jgi:hypothetical protein
LDSSKFDAKAVVMIIVATAWLAYIGTELARNRPPEIWTWGILTGVYAALYQPWAGRNGAQGRQSGQNEVPGPPAPPGLGQKPTEDET